MKLYIIAGNRYQVDGYARQDLGLRRDEFVRLTRDLRGVNALRNPVIILGPDYHREMGMRGMAELTASGVKTLHWHEDAAAITQVIADLRASLAE